MQNLNFKKIEVSTLTILVTFFILPISYLGFFNFYQADDFCRLSLSNNLVLINVYDEYFSSSGRYFHTFLSNFTFCYSFPFFYLIPFLTVSIIGYTSYLWAKILMDELYDRYIVSVLLTISFIVVLPSVSEGFFWWPGVNHYTWGPVLILLLINRVYFSKDTRFNNIINLIIIFMINGLNELNLISLNLFLAFNFVLQFPDKTKLKRNLTYLVISGFFASIALFAPGNFARAQLDAFQSTQNIFFDSLNWNYLFFEKTPYLCLVFFIPFCAKLNFKIKIKTILVWFLLIVFIIIIHRFFISITLKNLEWVGRIKNTLIIPQIVLFFLLGIFVKSLLIQKFIFLEMIQLKYLIIITSFFMFLKTENMQNVYYDILSGNAREYSSYMNKILKIRGALNPAKDIVVKENFIIPKSILFDEFKYDQNHWINKGVSGYLKVNSFNKKTDKKIVDLVTKKLESKLYSKLDSSNYIYDSELKSFIIKLEKNIDTTYNVIFHTYLEIDDTKFNHLDFTWADFKDNCIYSDEKYYYIIRPIPNKIKKVDLGVYKYETGDVRWFENSLIINSSDIFQDF